MNTSCRPFTSMSAILAGLTLVIGLALAGLALGGGKGLHPAVAASGGRAMAARPLATDTPVPGTWSYTGSLNQGRQDHTVTLLPNSQVLVAGGVGSSGFLSSAELYNGPPLPPTATPTPTDTPTPTATPTPISYWVYLPVVLKNP